MIEDIISKHLDQHYARIDRVLQLIDPVELDQCHREINQNGDEFIVWRGQRILEIERPWAMLT